MSLTGDLRAGYELVAKDLEGKRAAVHTEVATLQKKLRELDQNIAGLYREMGKPMPITVMRSSLSAHVSPDQRYAFISVHWAILHLLSEAQNPMATADIADALKNAGVRTKAANFVNNVSAVLSTNMRTKGEEEVEQLTDGRWKLTETGRNKIAFIVASPKFRRACPWIAEVGAA